MKFHPPIAEISVKVFLLSGEGGMEGYLGGPEGKPASAGAVAPTSVQGR